MHAGYGPGRPYLARLVANRRVTAEGHFQDTRHLEFDLGDSGLSYEPGDVLAIVPRQPQSAVDEFLRHMGLRAEDRVRIELAETPSQSAALPIEASFTPEAQQLQMHVASIGPSVVHGRWSPWQCLGGCSSKFHSMRCDWK
jgi:sulfite reductase alpha subunit-like flavoprotein